MVTPMKTIEKPSVDLHDILRVGQLPAMPHSAACLLGLTRDPNNGPAEYAIVIEADPGLTVQALRFVNSSYFGFRQKIASVKQAITLVGVRTIKNFVLYSAVFSLIPNPKCGNFDLAKLWQDSLRRAIFARTMGKLLGMGEAEEPFAAALLQDMAVPLLAKESPGAYATLFGARDKVAAQIRLSRLEERVFGWTHAQAAGIMARQWDLPEGFATLIEDHLEIDQWAAHADSEPGRLAVSLSALLPTADEKTWSEYSSFEKYYYQVRPANAPSIKEVLDDVDHQFADFAPILRIAKPGHTLVDRYRTQDTEETNG
jgi:HD-like signal output (HDOD) protein